MFSKGYYIAGLLAAVILAALLLTCIGGFALSAFGSFGKTSTPVQPAPFPRPADGLRVELNTALVPEFPFNFEQIGNPFADKTGVSLAVGKNIAPLPPIHAVAPSVAPPVFSRQPVSPTVAGNYPGGGNMPPPAPIQSPIKPSVNMIDTNNLVLERGRQMKLGKDVPPLASVYGIDDVRPYGIVGSGENNKVKFYSPATGGRFSVSRGTRFRDGTIESINDEGVQFRRDNGEVVFNRWVKNTANKENNRQPNAPIIHARPPLPQITDSRP